MQDNIFSRIAAALALAVAGGGSRGNPEYDAHLKAIDDQLQAGAAHEAADNTAQSARLDVLEQGILTIATALPTGSGPDKWGIRDDSFLGQPVPSALPTDAGSSGGDTAPADPMTGALPVSDANGGDSAPASDVPPAAPSDTSGVVGTGGAADTGSGAAPAGADVPATPSTSGTDTGGGEEPPVAPAA